MVEPDHEDLSISTQFGLLSISRSSFYYVPVGESEENLEIMRLLDEQYMSTPFYGVLRLAALLKLSGYPVNVKRVRRLMKLVNWRTIFREPKTTISQKTHYKYPYLLRNLEIVRCNQVWSMDITYIPMKKGFMYLTAIIDLYSRYVVSWNISNTLEAECSLNVLKNAISLFGKPEIVNSDQGSQFTSELWIEYLEKNEIKISMDGKGRALDNIFIERLWRSVKYDYVYLNPASNGNELYQGLKEYFDYYNHQQAHQGIGRKIPVDLFKPAA